MWWSNCQSNVVHRCRSSALLNKIEILIESTHSLENVNFNWKSRKPWLKISRKPVLLEIENRKRFTGKSTDYCRWWMWKDSEIVQRMLLSTAGAVLPPKLNVRQTHPKLWKSTVLLRAFVFMLLTRQIYNQTIHTIQSIREQTKSWVPLK